MNITDIKNNDDIKPLGIYFLKISSLIQKPKSFLKIILMVVIVSDVGLLRTCCGLSILLMYSNELEAFCSLWFLFHS